MAENGRPSERGHLGEAKWHQSLWLIVAIVVIGAIVTSPCWGFALIAWVTK